MNDPYRGTSDGHHSGYRRRYSEDSYLAIELEINQRLVAGDPTDWLVLQQTVASSLRTALDALA
jgi:hypothetical protein